jgi:hypothetical protein
MNNCDILQDAIEEVFYSEWPNKKSRIVFMNRAFYEGIESTSLTRFLNLVKGFKLSYIVTEEIPPIFLDSLKNVHVFIFEDRDD